MHPEFVDHYNRELTLLKEMAREFAGEYPGIADRLGGLMQEQSDPMLSGLLEGAAFLAARVQLKLKHEFPEFTANLLEQLVPNYLAPTPSTLLLAARPTFGDPALREGQTLRRDSIMDATYMERERRVACRFRLCSDVTLWPFDVAAAEYVMSPGPLRAIGVPVGRDTLAGLRLTLRHRSLPRLEDEPNGPPGPEAMFAGCRVQNLPFHLQGNEGDAVALYEQIFGRCVGVWFRYVDAAGNPQVIQGPPDCLSQIGFEQSEALFPNDPRIFEGFDLLREYFLLPSKLLGFNLGKLERVIPRVKARTVEVIFAFSEVNSRLSGYVKPSVFGLYCAPAINLFEMTMDRVQVRTNGFEHHVVPDRTRQLDYEPHRVIEVSAHFKGQRERVRVRPLYSAAAEVAASYEDDGLFYTIRRLPRRRATAERENGSVSDYVGTEMFISVVEPSKLDEESVAELSVRALCSNRHLTEHLPVGDGGADFRLLDNVELDLVCVAGPTSPREPIVSQMRARGDASYSGAVTWRLINTLSLNHLGLVERGGGRNGAALREVLAMFANLADATTERRIRGIRSVDGKPVTRRVRRPDGVGVARGLEVTVTIEDKAFEGSGVFLLGAVLERFFAQYAGINHFTQTVVRTPERGEIMRWPARIGSRRAL